MEELKHYLSLAAMLSIGFGLLWFFNYHRQVQMGIVLMIAVSYVLWGTIHHSIKKDFHWQVLLEYIVVAAVTSLVVIFLLWRA